MRKMSDTLNSFGANKSKPTPEAEGSKWLLESLTKCFHFIDFSLTPSYTIRVVRLQRRAIFPSSKTCRRIFQVIVRKVINLPSELYVGN